MSQNRHRPTNLHRPAIMKTTPTQARLAEQLSVPLYDAAMLNAVAAESHTRALTHADLEMGADKLEVIALSEPFLGRNLLSSEHSRSRLSALALR